MKILFFISILFAFCEANSQIVTNVRAELQGEKVLITYNMQGSKNTTYYVQVFCSANNYSSPLKFVSGDVMGGIKPRNGEIIVWDYNKEDLVGLENIDFKIIAKEEHTGILKSEGIGIAIKPAQKSPANLTMDTVLFSSEAKVREHKNKPSETLLMGGIALHPSQTSGFLMVGKMKSTGGYFKLKSNLNFNTKSYLNQSSNQVSSYEIDQTCRYAITIGVLQKITSQILYYGGLGFGERWVNGRTSDGKICKIIDISPKGLEIDTGIILKFRKITFSGGVSSTAFSYLEFNGGFGVLF